MTPTDFKATTLLPSPMHLDLPPIDASDLGHGPDSPTTSLIQSLRDQLTQLHDQSQLLNTKLVTSISRHADLEDQHVHLQHQHKELQERSEVRLDLYIGLMSDPGAREDTLGGEYEHWITR